LAGLLIQVLIGSDGGQIEKMMAAAGASRGGFLLLVIVTAIFIGSAKGWNDAAATLLAKGDAASENKLDQSIGYYLEGIQALPQRWSDEDGCSDENNDSQLPDEKEIEVILSLHTNLGTALSYMNGSSKSVLSSYRTSALCYRKWKRQMEKQSPTYHIPKGIKDIATQAYFFLGMTYQDLASTETDGEEQKQLLEHAGRSYAAASNIDPNHWSSYANLGVVLSDVGIDSSTGNSVVSLGMYEEGIMSYQKAIDILTGARGGDHNDGGDDLGPTDPPENVREVVSELHYRIGLSLVPFLFMKGDDNDDGSNDDYSDRQCTLSIESTPTTRSCLELSAFQFQTALQYHPHHEGANNALIIATADATFGMSTDVNKVKNLFEEYAPTFEHSLVDELGYNGFQRMRGGFDRAMKAEGRRSDRKFKLVVDAGCGTGLAGEVVSVFFNLHSLPTHLEIILFIHLPHM
jgi:hypothetical protein